MKRDLKEVMYDRLILTEYPPFPFLSLSIF